jgi:type III secretory pathway component EscS
MPGMHKYGESKTAQIIMTPVPHVSFKLFLLISNRMMPSFFIIFILCLFSVVVGTVVGLFVHFLFAICDVQYILSNIFLISSIALNSII